MAGLIQGIRGMNDLLPGDSARWMGVERQLIDTVTAYGYQEIRMPVLEHTGLFCRAIGEVTDVVEKEMYTFTDRPRPGEDGSGEQLSLRPEGTAGCVRACLEHNLLRGATPRLWYMGAMYRHERPQKGRLREFHQFGCEIFGLEGPDIDAEIILLTATMFKKLGILDELTLELNCLGSAEERAAYRTALVSFLEQHFDELDEDSRRRTHQNPLRVLDSKDPRVGEILKDAPVLSDYFGAQTREHFATLQALLQEFGISFKLNPRLVRGLDYYNLTVFEWTTTHLGAQATVCGGGRYDGLVAELGGTPTVAVGFALGLERLMLLLEELDKMTDQPAADVYVLGQGGSLCGAQALLAQRLREALPGVRVLNHCGGGNFRRQFKGADRSGARVAVILGEDEQARNLVTLKHLRDEGIAQCQCSFAEAVAQIGRWLGQ